jgi:uncharacterized protein RhaS with RHS repeats
MYLRNRYYDPATAQFLNRDPAVAVTRAPYSYAGNDPLNGIDPTGLLAILEGGCDPFARGTSREPPTGLLRLPGAGSPIPGAINGTGSGQLPPCGPENDGQRIRGPQGEVLECTNLGGVWIWILVDVPGPDDPLPPEPPGGAEPGVWPWQGVAIE